MGYSIMTKPQREAQMAERLRQDSIARAEQIRSMAAAAEAQSQQEPLQSETQESADSLNLERLQGELGDFANAATGSSEQVVIENENLKLTFSTLGGRPYTVQLKNYQTHDSLPLYLFDGDSTIFALQFFAGTGESIRENCISILLLKH